MTAFKKTLFIMVVALVGLIGILSLEGSTAHLRSAKSYQVIQSTRLKLSTVNKCLTYNARGKVSLTFSDCNGQANQNFELERKGNSYYTFYVFWADRKNNQAIYLSPGRKPEVTAYEDMNKNFWLIVKRKSVTGASPFTVIRQLEDKTRFLGFDGTNAAYEVKAVTRTFPSGFKWDLN